MKILAPAKINLFLHVTGRRDDGYHLLDSLVAFADIGDEIRLEKAQDFRFDIRGPYAAHFSAAEKDCSPDSSNIAVRAVWALARAAQKKPDLRLTLVKNLPLGAGIGGGSADAAAVLWGLGEMWGLPPRAPYFEKIMLELGADVPVCMACRPSHVTGIGEVVTPVQGLPEIPVLLVNPGVICRTAEVFRGLACDFKKPMEVPEHFNGTDHLFDVLAGTGNDLMESAVSVVPAIRDVLRQIGGCAGVRLSRMSGSGATCFALFDDPMTAMDAAENLSMANPAWWIRTGWINRPARY